MAQKKRRGFKAPANYDPNRTRAPKRKYGGAATGQGGSEGAGGSGRARRGQQDLGSAEDMSNSRGSGIGGADRRSNAGGRGGQGSGGGRDGQGSERSQRPGGAERGAKRLRPAGETLQNFTPKVWTTADASGRSFGDLGLGQNLVRTLGELGADLPFPIQVATIPDTIAGRDVLGRAETGSGKTIAFGAALVERLLVLKAEGKFGEPAPKKAKQAKRGERVSRGSAGATRKPKALILAPTRELALQIDRTVQPLARSVGFYTAQLVGGVPSESQVHALERGVDIVIGTPGRIRDLVERRKLDLREVQVSIVDEADHLCELGFLEETQWTLRQTERGGQRLLFSATLDRDVEELVGEFLVDPAAHEIERTVSTVPHRVYMVMREDKDAAVLEFAKIPGRVMLFSRTRAAAERITEELLDAGVSATSLHGNLSQARREINLKQFATGKARVLVATDVAARGIHIDDVDAVVQLDPPQEAKTFVHRSGRTGRAGRGGQVVTLIPRTWQKRTREMLDEAGIEPLVFEAYEPKRRPKSSGRK
ncbi:DEAD/DEAH box helicase [Leucobacter aridicollis]|uniref:DEAD/DEAH box helicase n=1 Tax=Leucobacter aridicollis TaxID=283878 RepID=UPI0021689F24|nr:DEAD/DEAH box helicase [Leucobacter aridicollis]MCS3427320.1 superfamily II DNA/RNA helicase [Leucobacter aridicollis]